MGRTARHQGLGGVSFQAPDEKASVADGDEEIGGESG